MSVGFANNAEQRRAVDILRRSERRLFTDRLPQGIVGAIVRPGEIYSDPAYREGVLTWFDPASDDYVDGDVTVLVRCHGGDTPPPEGQPLLCTLSGQLDDMAVYVAGMSNPVCWIRCDATTYEDDLPAVGYVQVEDGANGYQDGLEVRLTMIDGTTALERVFVADERYLCTLNGSVGGYELYHGHPHHEKCIDICTDPETGTTRTDRWRVPGLIIDEDTACDEGSGSPVGLLLAITNP